MAPLWLRCPLLANQSKAEGGTGLQVQTHLSARPAHVDGSREGGAGSPRAMHYIPPLIVTVSALGRTAEGRRESAGVSTEVLAPSVRTLTGVY